MMKKGDAAADPADHLARLTGWQREPVPGRRDAILASAARASRSNRGLGNPAAIG